MLLNDVVGLAAEQHIETDKWRSVFVHLWSGFIFAKYIYGQIVYRFESTPNIIDSHLNAPSESWIDWKIGKIVVLIPKHVSANYKIFRVFLMAIASWYENVNYDPTIEQFRVVSFRHASTMQLTPSPPPPSLYLQSFPFNLANELEYVIAMPMNFGQFTVVLLSFRCLIAHVGVI